MNTPTTIETEAAPGSAIAPEATAYAQHLLSLDAPARTQERRIVDRTVLAKLPDDEIPEPGPSAAYLDFDFEAPLEPPDYLVDRMFERQTVNLMSADTGAGKSILAQSLTVAAARDEQWLGREVSVERTLYIDEENPLSVVFGRLRALGMENGDRDRLRYANRQGVTLGEAEWNQWLRREAAAHEADLVIVDTASAATAADLIDNGEVAQLYKGLRPIASELNLAILLIHHERKPQAGVRSNSSMATLGARQWVGQADRQVTLKLRGEQQVEATPDGGRKLRTEIKLDPAAKDRTGEFGQPELIAVTSEKDAEGRLLWMKVESEGEIEAAETESELLGRPIPKT